MWAAARETTKLGFEAKMEMMRKVDVNAYGHLMGIDCAHWSRHAFSTWPKCDMLLNNLCESFNSKIVDARDKSILTMCEMIRRYLMKRIPRNRDTMLKKSGPICPKIQDKVEVNKEATRDCTSTWSGGSKFEVHCKGKQFVVDLEKHTCACYRWDITGIPCMHAVSAIAYKKEKVESYVHSYYKVETYLRTYSHLIQPINGEDFWPNVVGDKILPPKMLVQPGRPKENKRKKAADEAPRISHKLKKSSAAQKCGNCGQLGLNKRGCKLPPKSNDASEGQTKQRQGATMNTSSQNHVRRAGGDHVFMGLRVKEDHHPPSVARSQSTIVST